MACFHRNLWAHLYCWFYRMASVQYKQHSLWKVSVCLQSSSLFFFSWALLKLSGTFWHSHNTDTDADYFSRSFSIGLYSGSLLSHCPAAAGSAVSVKPASDPVTQASVSSMGTLTDSPASLLTASNQTSLSALGHSEDLPPSTIPPPQHNKWDAAKLAQTVKQ